MHQVKRMSPYVVVTICLFLALPMSLGAKWRAKGNQQDSASSNATAQLDYEFFKTKVEPIFLEKRPGHVRCVTCHSVNNAPLHLVPLSPGSTTWNEEESRQNFELVKRVAIPGNLQSTILIHPLAEQAGGDFFHSGSKFFNSQNDPEWLTLKAFVLGEKAKR
jgi:hypothetical protein